MTSNPQPQQQHHPQQKFSFHETTADLNNNLKQGIIKYRWPSLLSSDVSNPSFRWAIGSRFVVPAVGLFSKFWMNVANKSTIYNANILYETLNRNYLSLTSRGSLIEPSGTKKILRRPVITYCNHTSCMDDPLIWGSLMPFVWLLNSTRQRWTSAAAEICFQSPLYSVFFSLGKTFPIFRGEGIYQPAMDYAARLIRHGNWLHIFPEGKVIPRLENADINLLKLDLNEDQQLVNNYRSQTSEPYSLKWGMARLIIEHVLSEGEDMDKEYFEIKPKNCSIEELPDCKMEDFQTLPEVDVLPMYHIGMDDVLPTKRPYIPRVFRHVTFLIRPEGPIRIDRNFLKKLFNENNDQQNSMELSLTEKRIRLMKFLENELNKLAIKAKALHFNQDKR